MYASVSIRRSVTRFAYAIGGSPRCRYRVPIDRFAESKICSFSCNICALLNDIVRSLSPTLVVARKITFAIGTIFKESRNVSYLRGIRYFANNGVRRNNYEFVRSDECPEDGCLAKVSLLTYRNV